MNPAQVTRVPPTRPGLGRHWGWAALNVAGIALYSVQASVLWSRGGPAEGLPPGYARFWAGDAFLWALTMVPVLVAFLLLDVTVLFFIVSRTPAPNRRRALVLWLVVAALWGGALAVDSHLSPTLVGPEATGGEALKHAG